MQWTGGPAPPDHASIRLGLVVAGQADDRVARRAYRPLGPAWQQSGQLERLTARAAVRCLGLRSRACARRAAMALTAWRESVDQSRDARPCVLRRAGGVFACRCKHRTAHRCRTHGARGRHATDSGHGRPSRPAPLLRARVRATDRRHRDIVSRRSFACVTRDAVLAQRVLADAEAADTDEDAAELGRWRRRLSPARQQEGSSAGSNR